MSWASRPLPRPRVGVGVGISHSLVAVEGDPHGMNLVGKRTGTEITVRRSQWLAKQVQPIRYDGAKLKDQPGHRQAVAAVDLHAEPADIRIR